MKVKMPDKKSFKLYQVNITYRCNKNCNYCYAKDLKEDYNKDMDIEDFKTLLGWFEKNNINYFNMLGGEPTLHPLIGDMLTLTSEKNFKITLFSNGLFPETFLNHIDKVHSFLINYNQKSMYTCEEYELLHKNLAYLKQKNKHITFAFNITDDIESCDHIIESAKKYGVERVNIDFVTPNAFKNNEYISSTSLEKNKEKLIKFLKEFKEKNIIVKATRPLPFCIFKNEIKENKGVLSSSCSVGYGIISINPDLSIFPCLSIFFKGPKITSFKSFEEIISFYHEAINDIKWKRYLYPDCKSCIYFVRKKCQGSCLCHKCAQFDVLNKPDYTLFSQYKTTDINMFVDTVDKAVESLNKIFGKRKYRFKIYLFNNKKDMLYYSGTYHYPEWVTGFSSKNAYYQTTPKINRRVIHEICHVYINDKKEREIPLWLEEGFCEYLTYKDENDSKLKSIMKEKEILPFDKLFDRDKLYLLKYDASPLDKNIAYIQSRSMVNYLINKFGKNLVMKLITRGYQDFKQYFEESTKQKFEDLEKEWLNSLKLNPFKV